MLLSNEQLENVNQYIKEILSGDYRHGVMLRELFILAVDSRVDAIVDKLKLSYRSEGLEDQVKAATMNILGMYYWSQRDDVKAIDFFEEAIGLGNSFAMCFRGFMHLEGRGGQVNYDEAIRLTELAIAQGCDVAMFNRARMHVDGRGGPINYAEAIRLYELAIAQGCGSAMLNRAYMHHNGHGGPVNYDEAIRLYELAMAQGNIAAMNNRAYMHHHGEGGPVNYDEAIRLYELAIAQGNISAMTNRACMHHHGHGGPVNHDEAIRLYELAIAQGCGNAMLNRACMHGDGIGGPVNYVKAILLFDQAYEKGCVGSRAKRKRWNSRLSDKDVSALLDLIWDQLLQDKGYSCDTEELLMKYPRLVADKLIAMDDFRLSERIVYEDCIIGRICRNTYLFDFWSTSEKDRVLAEAEKLKQAEITWSSGLFHKAPQDNKKSGYSSEDLYSKKNN